MQSGAQSGGLSSGSWPSYGFPSSSPFSQPPAMSPLPQNPSTSAPMPGFPGSTPGYGSQAGQQSGQSGYPPTQTGRGYPYGQPNYPGDTQHYDMLPATGALPAQPASQSAPQQAGSPLSQQVLESIPRRTMLSEHIEQLPLDRRERMVLLLIDGRRTLIDLARLTRRTERELFAVLNHLAGLGLVQMSS